MAMRLARRGFLVCGAAAMAAAADRTRVTLVMAAGLIEIDVAVREAPLSSADFLRYVDAKDYDGGTIFRVVRPDNDHGSPVIDVVQGGIRAGARKLPPIAHETTAMTGLRHLDGTISLPRDGVGTGSGAEFFICIGDQPGLDFGGHRNKDGQGFAAFGRVVSGMAIVRSIWRMKADGPSLDAYTVGQILTHPAVILSARRS
jgi:peptidyl-prolyl cis-trans isomerase A (cyclophilin A)